MDDELKRRVSKKYRDGLYGIWWPRKKMSSWRWILFLYPVNAWYPILVWFPRRSYYLFGSFELKDPGIATPREMSAGERDFYLRSEAYYRACKISKIYNCKPWEELCTPKVFLKEIINQWRFIRSNNAPPYTRMCFFLNLIIYTLVYLAIVLGPLIVICLFLYYFMKI